MSYYYLVSSLPGISLNAAPSMGLPAFLSLCKDHLSDRDFQALTTALAPEATNTGSDHPFIKAWSARETQLRNAAARLRAVRRQEDAGTFIRDHIGFDVCLEEGVEEAFNLPTPLVREQALDRIRWQILDDIVGVDLFCAKAVLAYGVKLQLSERWAGMDSERGMTRIKSAISETPENKTDSTKIDAATAAP